MKIKKILALLLAAAMTMAGSVVAMADTGWTGNASQGDTSDTQKGIVDLSIAAVLDRDGGDVSSQVVSGDGILLEANKLYYLEIDILGLDEEQLAACQPSVFPLNQQCDAGWVYTGASAYPSTGDRLPYWEGSKLYAPVVAVFSGERYGVYGPFSCPVQTLLDDDNYVDKTFRFRVSYPDPNAGVDDAGAAGSNSADTGSGSSGGTGATTKPAAKEASSRDPADDSNHQAEKAAMDAVEAIRSGATNAAAKLQTVTTAAGDAISAVQVKLYGMGASLSIDSMETMAGASVGLKVSLDNGAAEVLIPGGFTLANDPGRVCYPLGYQKNPYNTDVMRSLVKDADAKTEVYKVGGGSLPTTASVTLKTKLAGNVNIYCWNEETRRVTLLAAATAENGRVSFATKQLGNLIITTGTI